MIYETLFQSLYLSAYLIMFYFSILYTLANDLGDIKIKKNKIEDGLALILVLFIALIVGLRDISVGTDTGNYYHFWWLSLDSISSKKDFLMLFWMKLINYFIDDYQYFLFFNSLLFTTLFFLSAKKISKNYRINILFVIFSYYSMFFMKNLEINIVRQGLSLASLLLAYQYHIEKKKRTAFLFAIVSVFFHYISIVPLFLYIFVKLFHRVKTQYLILTYGIF